MLVLRPEPGASATVERARQRGLEALAVPLFVIEPVEWRSPDVTSFDGLLLTSANAVRHAGPQINGLRALRTFVVGEATGEAARHAGFDIAAVGEAGIERLLGSIEADLRLLHLCGEDRLEPEQVRQAITPLVVYRSRAIESPDLSTAPGSVALIHSPRAGQRFAELMRHRDATTLAAISQSAARAAGHGWEQVESAERPSEDALLALAARLCNKSHPE